MSDDQEQPETQVLVAEGFDLPTQPAPEPPTLPLVREVLIRVPARHNTRLQRIIVRVADALDMAKGRSRIAFEAGQINIHSISAAAIDHIAIQPGEHKPVQIAVEMLNSAGVFQLDALLKEKLSGSGLEPYVEVIATIQGEAEKKLIEVFRV
jgi:uncharacterized protein